jgi:hypothetical protein
VIINWEKANGPYVVTFRDLFDENIEVIETPETSAQIDLSSPKFAQQQTIMVEVKSKGDGKLKSNNIVLKRLNPAQAEAIKKELSEVTTDAMDENALNKFILAGFYEQHSLLVDAITAYEQAIKLAPDVPSYKEAYDEFLFRNNLKVENP